MNTEEALVCCWLNIVRNPAAVNISPDHPAAKSARLAESALYGVAPPPDFWSPQHIALRVAAGIRTGDLFRIVNGRRVLRREGVAFMQRLPEALKVVLPQSPTAVEQTTTFKTLFDFPEVCSDGNSVTFKVSTEWWATIDSFAEKATSLNEIEDLRFTAPTRPPKAEAWESRVDLLRMACANGKLSKDDVTNASDNVLSSGHYRQAVVVLPTTYQLFLNLAPAAKMSVTWEMQRTALKGTIEEVIFPDTAPLKALLNDLEELSTKEKQYREIWETAMEEKTSPYHQQLIGVFSPKTVAADFTSETVRGLLQDIKASATVVPAGTELEVTVPASLVDSLYTAMF